MSGKPFLKTIRSIPGTAGVLCRWSKKHQQGQAIIELALIAPFLAVILLAMLIISEVSTTQVNSIKSLRHSMRISMHANAAGDFHKKTSETTFGVDVPGKMKQVFKTPVIQQKLEFHYYEGSYQGTGKNIYRTLGQPYREIKD